MLRGADLGFAFPKNQGFAKPDRCRMLAIEPVIDLDFSCYQESYDRR